MMPCSAEARLSQEIQMVRRIVEALKEVKKDLGNFNGVAMP